MASKDLQINIRHTLNKSSVYIVLTTPTTQNYMRT